MTAKNKGNIWAHAALFLVNTLYGASHVLAKGVMPTYLSPSVFIFFRVLGATLLFWLLLFFIKSNKIERKDWFRLVGCGLFGVTINQLFFFHGLNLSSSVNSGIIMAFNPIMVIILSAFLLREKIGLAFLLLYPPVVSELAVTDFTVIPSDIWMKICYVVVGVTFLTYLLTMFGLKHLSPSVSSSYIYFQPMMVIGFAYLFLYLNLAPDYTATITLEKIIYMLLIFVGVYLTGKPTRKTNS